MTETVTLKDTKAMTVPELRAEIVEAGLEPPNPTTKKKLQEVVDGIRMAAAAPDAQEPQDEPETVEGVVVEESSPDAPETALVPPEVQDEIAAAIALRETPVAPVAGLPTPAQFNSAQTIALAIASTKMVPEVYRGRPDDVLAAILFGAEIGLPPMTALRDIYMIDGRPALAAHRQLGALRRGGVTILESESTAERAYIKARRADTGEVMSVEFTMDEAKKVIRKGKALVDGDNWRSYPADMLWARCVGRLTRRLGPDLIGGLPPYVAEEVADFEGWGVEYGTQGEVRVGRFANAPQAPSYRQEFPDYNWPDNWAELISRMSERIGEPETKEWIRQMVEALNDGTDSIAALSVDRRRLMFQKASGALHTVEAFDGDLAFDPAIRAHVASAFAPRIDGQILPGPPWRLSPTEMDRPQHADWVDDQAHADEQEAAAAPVEEAPTEMTAEERAAWEALSPEEQAAADEIQFGDEGGAA